MRLPYRLMPHYYWSSDSIILDFKRLACSCTLLMLFCSTVLCTRMLFFLHTSLSSHRMIVNYFAESNTIKDRGVRERLLILYGAP